MDKKQATRYFKHYKELDFVVMPLNRGEKTPFLNDYYNIDDFNVLEGDNMGIITGERSGITVLDFDFCSYDKKKKKIIENTRTIDYWNKLNLVEYPHQKTASGGYHVFFEYDKDLKTCNLRSKGYDMEIKNNKAYVVIAPSIIDLTKRQKTGSYSWIVKPWKIEIKKMPIELKQELMDIINSSSENSSNNTDDRVIEILNEEFEEEYKWTITKESTGSYRLHSNSKDCFVKLGSSHTDTINHSTIYLNKINVVATCYSDNNKKIKINDNWRKIKQILGLTKEKDNSKKSNHQILCNRMIEEAEIHKYKRSRAFIMKPNERIPVLYERHIGYKDFINELFNRGDQYENIFDKSPANMNNLMKFLENNDKKNFPFLKHNIHICAFNNGYYDFSNPYDEKFIEYERLANNYSTSIHFDIDFNEEWLDMRWNDIKTPIIDTILKHQFLNEDEKNEEFGDIYETFFGMAGRLHYPIHKYDNFNCCMFIKGSSNTGKSTVGDIIMHSHQNVGTISGKMEGTFGLQSVYEKPVIYCSDLPSNIHNKLDKGDFQRMVSGECLDIPIKGSASINNFKWDSPMLFLGNYYFGWADPSGAISRRLAVFLMEKYVANRDSSIKKRCIKEEGHLILIKSIKAYSFICERFKHKTFEDFGINYFKENYNDITADGNYLYRFLTIPPSSFESWVAHEGTVENAVKDVEVKLQDFKKIYEKWLYFQDKTLKRKDKIIDSTTLRREGYIKKRSFICAHCGQKPKGGRTAENYCCVNYNNSNRRELWVIKNMRIFKRVETTDYES